MLKRHKRNGICGAKANESKLVQGKKMKMSDFSYLWSIISSVHMWTNSRINKERNRWSVKQMFFGKNEASPNSFHYTMMYSSFSEENCSNSFHCTMQLSYFVAIKVGWAVRVLLRRSEQTSQVTRLN